MCIFSCRGECQQHTIYPVLLANKIINKRWWIFQIRSWCWESCIEERREISLGHRA
jgi:hypothetical protein